MEEYFMQRFKNILVVIDRRNDCDALVGRAVSLAHRNKVPLTRVPCTFTQQCATGTGSIVGF